MRRLDIDPDDVAAAPKEPSEILTRCLGVKKGLPRQRILDFAAVSQQPCAMRFTAAMHRLNPKDVKNLSFEAMCVHAQVSPLEMLGAIMASAINMKAVESKLKAALAHPDVVQSTIKAAKNQKFGQADRKMLHEAVGFLPTKQGGGIEINLGFGRPVEDREGGDEEADWDEAFPALGEVIQDLSADKHKVLEASVKR